MATHVATNPATAPPGADSKTVAPEHAGASYAHAVLNFKQVDNNKENINESATMQEAPSRNKVNVLTDTKEPLEPPSLDDGGGGFTPVVSHSRKDRKNERNKKNRDLLPKLPNGSAEKRDNNREPAREPPKETVPDKEEAVNKKVFVEAPLPTVNPWQKKNSPAAVKEAEKRVLQPQKQDLVVNGQPQPSRPPKEKKKVNQKVISDSAFHELLHIVFAIQGDSQGIRNSKLNVRKTHLFFRNYSETISVKELRLSTNIRH